MTTSNRQSGQREAAAQRRSVNLTRDPEAGINVIARLQPEDSLSETIHQGQDLLAWIIKRSLPTLNLAQWNLVCDALKPHWQPDEARIAQLPTEIMHAVNEEKLGDKWGVDPQALKSTLDHSSFTNRVAITKVAQWFWQSSDRDNPDTDYDTILTGILKAIDTPTRITETPRPYRMNPDRRSRQGGGAQQQPAGAKKPQGGTETARQAPAGAPENAQERANGAVSPQAPPNTSEVPKGPETGAQRPTGANNGGEPDGKGENAGDQPHSGDSARQLPPERRTQQAEETTGRRGR